MIFRESKSTQWADVQALWPGKLPHAVVHINDILNTAAASGIGVAGTIGGGGMIRLTTDSLKIRRLYFLPMQPNSSADPAGKYRCQADADKYNVEKASWKTKPDARAWDIRVI